MNWNRVVVGAIAVLALVVVYDALQSDGKPVRRSSNDDYRIDLESSRDGSPLPVSMLRAAFPGRRPASLAVSKVAVDAHGTVALGVSHVPGNRPPRAAIELWRGEEHLRSFSVQPGSFAGGLWFTGGDAIATIGWDERGYLYDLSGRPLSGTAYFAYETG
ncbi:MAG: hypothetical protein QOI67_45 [Gaiellaceae bacterium]|nr:hypothetical protein [Gaiellaceae bacterium]